MHKESSSKSVESRDLARRTRTFLEELANLRDEKASRDRFVHHYDAYCPGFITHFQSNGQFEAAEIIELEDRACRRRLSRAQELLRYLWSSGPDARTRLRRINLFEIDVLQHMDRRYTVAQAAGDPLPPPSMFEVLMAHARKMAHLMHKCANPACRGLTYFVARRRSHKFCCIECTQPAQRHSKRLWWQRHGRQLRRERSSIAKKLAS